MQGGRRLSMYMKIFGVASYCMLLLHTRCHAFHTAHLQAILILSRSSARVPALYETKREGKAKGFGKKEISQANPSTRLQEATKLENSSGQPNVPLAVSISLKNIDEPNDSVSPEERGAQILREKYGMKSFEKQQLDAVQLARRSEEKKKWAEMKKKAQAGEEFDLFTFLPAPIAIAIDRFLKAGTILCSVAFVASGVLIAVEAGSKSFGEPLPTGIDDFIVNTIEPNFTPGLLVLLSFSVSLGVFASLQLGSQGASYKEK